MIGVRTRQGRFRNVLDDVAVLIPALGVAVWMTVAAWGSGNPSGYAPLNFDLADVQGAEPGQRYSSSVLIRGSGEGVDLTLASGDTRGGYRVDGGPLVRFDPSGRSRVHLQEGQRLTLEVVAPAAFGARAWVSAYTSLPPERGNAGDTFEVATRAP